MEAVTSSSPPAGAPTLAEVVWMRPDVHVVPLPSAVMSRSPLPSRWTLLVEFVMVSISPVPKLEPAPVSYIHCESMPEPEEPLKSSLKVVVQPDGAPGTVCGAALAVDRAAGAAGPAGVAEAVSCVPAISAMTGAIAAARTAARRARRQRRQASRATFG